MTAFVHLRCYTDYSLGASAIKVRDLVKYSLKNGFPAAAITDKNNLFASLEYSMEAMKSGLQPIIGIDLSVNYGKDTNANLLLIAKDNTGYSHLLDLASRLYTDQIQNAPLAISFQDVCALSEGIICFAANPINSYEWQSFTKSKNFDPQFLVQLHGAFQDRLYIELIRTGETNGEHTSYENHTIDFAYAHNIPIVATNYVSFLDATAYEAQDALYCIANGRYIIEDDRPRLPKSFYLKSKAEMESLFADLPEALANTEIVARRVHVTANARGALLPKFTTEENEEEMLRRVATEGLNERLEGYSDDQKKQYFERLDYELAVINKMQYPGYFLIVSDFIRWSKANKIPVGPGRGSGAGSIVAWAMAITDLDPIRFGLLFERFLNPERVSMPDFDVDFCQDRRGEVIEYVTKKYGADRVAQIITFGKLQARAVLRDVGRVLNMPYGAIDKICKMVPNNPANPVTLKEAINLDKELQKQRDNDPEIKKLLDICLKLEGLNRHASTHAAGVVIADRPIKELVPLYKDSPTSMPAVQYSMKYAESAGLIKFDFLGLKTLTLISWAEQLVNERGRSLDVAKLELTDKKTYELLSKGLTTGVFQFESAGMKEAIKRLKPDSIEDLIALGSLYRPGPMDNIPSYIARKHGLEQPVYPHPLMEPILRETYGIIVYQEQVIEAAKTLAGYTLGGADLLRRAMGKKIKSEMDAQRAVFIDGCKKNGIEAKLADEIFALIEKFANYGFNKSHAAAYALISYQTAYLKANHTREFLVASINTEIHDTDKINLAIEEAKKFEITVMPPDINNSESYFSIKDDSIVFGLGALKNVGLGLTKNIVAERKANGAFKDMFDLVERLDKNTLNKRMLEGLARSGALDGLERNRRKIIQNIDLLLRYSNEFHNEKNSQQVGLFGFGDADISAKPALDNPQPWNEYEELRNEFEAFGFYLTRHPLEQYEAKLAKVNITESVLVEGLLGTKSIKLQLAGVITSRKVKSSKRGKYAFLQLSDRKGLIEISIFNEELLVKNDDLLQVGNVVYAIVDGRIDDTGMRLTTDSITDIESALQNVATALSVLIKEESAIETIKSLLSSNGKPIKLSALLPSGDMVSFKSSSPMFISRDNELKLRDIPNIEVIEH